MHRLQPFRATAAVRQRPRGYQTGRNRPNPNGTGRTLTAVRGGVASNHPVGRAGAVHYRTQLNATGRPSLPVLISEAGWKGHDEAAKAASIVAALQEEWLPDPRVEGVTPFLLADESASVFAKAGWLWILWPNTPTLQYANQLIAPQHSPEP